MIRLVGLKKNILIKNKDADIILSIGKDKQQSFLCDKDEDDLYVCSEITKEVNKSMQTKSKKPVKSKSKSKRPRKGKGIITVNTEEERQALAEANADLRIELTMNKERMRLQQQQQDFIDKQNLLMGFEPDKPIREDRRLLRLRNQYKRDLRGHLIADPPKDNIAPLIQIPFRPSIIEPPDDDTEEEDEPPVEDDLPVEQEKLIPAIRITDKTTKKKSLVLLTDEEAEQMEELRKAKADVEEIDEPASPSFYKYKTLQEHQRSGQGKIPPSNPEKERLIPTYKRTFNLKPPTADEAKSITFDELKSMTVAERNNYFRILNITGKNKLQQFIDLQK